MSDKTLTELHFTYKLKSRTKLKLKTETIPEQQLPYQYHNES